MTNTLIHIIPSNRWGGVQTYALDICRHYRDAGWEVTALTRNAVGVDTPFAEAGISLWHAPVAGFFDPATVLALAHRLRMAPAGRVVVHTHRYRDALTAIIARSLTKRRDVRIVTTRHRVRAGRNTFLFRKIYSLVDAHIFVSKMAADSFLDALRGPKLPAAKVHVLHNSLNLSPADHTLEPPRGPVSALYQGALMRGKGLETLIDAMALLKGSKMRLRIAGSGDPDYLDTLRARAMRRDVMESIDWNAKASPSLAACAEATFGVVPSAEPEAFSLESLRFMAAGRPQVATDNGAQREYLTDGHTALLIAPDNAEALADAMRRLGAEPDLRARLGDEALKEFNSHLSWPHFIDSLNKIYTE